MNMHVLFPQNNKKTLPLFLLFPLFLLPGVLLYHCQGGEIKGAWGMADALNLTANANLTLTDIKRTPSWLLCVGVIEKICGSVDSCDTHFHDYDNIEVWG